MGLRSKTAETPRKAGSPPRPVFSLLRPVSGLQTPPLSPSQIFGFSGFLTRVSPVYRCGGSAGFAPASRLTPDCFTSQVAPENAKAAF